MKNNNLNAAIRNKNDEFYTKLVDIENELRYYKDHFKGKTVYCNCDDPNESNFFKYFALNFKHLGLKRLITTSYSGNGGEAQKIDITNLEDVNGDDAFDMEDVNITLENNRTALKGGGDFRSDECIELLKQADIVVTNPPFSLFREYVAQLIEYDKKFLIIGNLNAVSYKNIFPLIRDDQMWLGINSPKEFIVPDENGSRKPAKRAMGFTRWFTNLGHPKRNDKLELYRKHSSELYPKYDNYDAIEVSKVVHIPEDYDGYMGVPITFLEKYNPYQFEIIKLAEIRPFINGKKLYARIIIKKRDEC